MTTAALKASLKLWQRRYDARVKLRSVARQDLLEARTSDVHPRQDLIERKVLREKQAEEALQNVKRREAQIAAKDAGRVREPFCRVKMDVACQSSRGGVKPRLIVLHDTEGANIIGITDLVGLGGWFDRISTQASSTVANDAEGNNARFVPDDRKAWAQSSFNPQALSIEQIGFASQTGWPAAQLRSTAQWIAFWSKKYGIPIVKSTEHGVCQHADLGAAGGGHKDCGPKYPFERVLAMARDYAENGW
jgi:hypothetical protein